MPDLPKNKNKLNQLTAVSGKQTDYRDKDGVPGLLLRVSPTGKKAWAVTARRPGHKNPSRFTLGDFREMTLTEARDAAIEFKATLRNGTDPLAERAEKRVAAEAAQLDLIDDLISKFAVHCEATNRTGAEQATMLFNDVLPHWKGRNVKTITRRDVRAVIELKKKSAPVRANRLLALIKRFFSWSVEQDILGENPARDIKRVSQETSRDRVLTDKELKAVWNAASEAGMIFGSITRLLILTAQRRDEVSSMRWSELDIDNGEWAVPAARSKNGVENRVPLTSEATNIIQAQLRIDGSDFVFPSGRNPMTRSFSGFGKSKARLDRISGVTDWRLHDLRRTAASGMARYQIAPHVVEKLLNHVSGVLGGVAGVYNRFGYDAEKRHALETWEAHIKDITEGTKTADNVVRLTV
jgi:integrase